ncbi:MAG TPA: enoyl-CoA hydratase-related protein [Candidatus Acidoferrum sp.]|jgi:enoyl-CoA hydratase/carnithine racemase
MPTTPAPAKPSTELIEIQRTGEVLTFTLINPDHGNEVTGPMFEAMLAELRSQAKSSRSSARVLRIRARGKLFCTGRERAGRDKKSIRAEAARLIAFKRAIRTSSMITVAEVHGDAFGFGLGLAIVCDFALVASHASLCFPEMRAGLAPAAIMAYLGEYALPRVAFPLVLFGEPFSPQRALEIGLISQVCASEDLSSEADALITRILQLNPDATRRCKQFFLTAQNNSYEKNCRLAIDALTQGTLAALGREK